MNYPTHTRPASQAAVKHDDALMVLDDVEPPSTRHSVRMTLKGASC